MLKSITLLFAVFLTGCTSFPVDYAGSTPVPNDRLGSAFTQYQDPASGKGKIVIIRDGGFGGSGSTSSLFINDEFLATVRPTQSLTLYMDPAEYELGHTYGLFQSAERARELIERNNSKQVLSVEAGETYYYRIRAIIGPGVILERWL